MNIAQPATTAPFLPDNLPPVITPKDAEALGISKERTLRQWCEQGRIQATKVGRRWYIPTAALLRQFGLME